ncbi:glycosyltransferase family 34 protein [Periconia macrospinosa]|uniref:Glycosyltransferase family 34 protein n=1 Tax=Periconia macrospinosa TaxID=97972 RepID=A0A2V1DKT0_9PLEO|nr:glycosyltransferase family 34 protein [Periconia macrospinosa]
MASASFNRPLCRRALIAVCSAILTIYIFLFTRPLPPASTSHSSLYGPRQSDVGSKPLQSPKKDADDKGHAHFNANGKSKVKDLYSDWRSNPSYLISHGSTTCMQPISSYTHSKARTTRRLCDMHSPFNLTTTPSRSPRIAALIAHYGSDRAYGPALQTHLLHGLVHEHEVHVLCDPIVDAVWNKPAFLLKLMMEEMMKPEEKRLEWIFWSDRDTMILDQCRPISSFLPPQRSTQDPPRPTPTPGLFTRLLFKIGLGSSGSNGPKNVHLLIANDKNGLNAGIFLLRVSHTSISFLTAILSYPTHHRKTRLRFKEQTAMSLLISTPEFRPHIQIVPQHWFNSYTGATVFAERMNTTGLEGGFREGYVRRGDFLVHFAGNKKKEQNVKQWAEMLDKEGVVWANKGGIQRDGHQEVTKFWKDLGY